MEENRTAKTSTFPVRMQKVLLKVPTSDGSIKPLPGNSRKVPEMGKPLSLLLKDMEEILRGFSPATRACCLHVPSSAKKRKIVLVLVLITFGFLFKLCDAFKKRRETGATVTLVS